MKNLKNLYYILLLFSTIIFRNAAAQDTELMLVRSNLNADAGIRIYDNSRNLIFDDRITPFSDTIWVMVEENKRFSLELSDVKKSEKDTSYLNVFVNEVPVLIIHSDIDAGDHSWNFYSGIDKPILRIVGGTTVNVEDYPWQVLVRAGNYLCGGTIIADKWVLTAAHCLYDEDDKRIPDENIYFRAGTNEPFGLTPDGERYDIILSVVHEDYNPENFENDLALLRTSRVIDNEFTQPINIITPQEVAAGATDPGKTVTITGWGLTSVDPDEFPDKLQKIDIPIVSETIARSIWGPLPDKMLMAGYADGRGDACSGDSGGPLIVKLDDEFKLAGIVSWGSSGCNTIGGYVRVSEFFDWLTKNTGVGQDKFRTIRAVGNEFRCQNAIDDPSPRTYTSDTLTEAIAYEWKVEPENAGSIVFEGTTAEITWANDFSGEAYVSVRALTPDGYTNWSGQRVVTGLVTQILREPENITVCVNYEIFLSVQATGSELIYTWIKDGVILTSGKDSSYSLIDAGLQDNGVYSVQVSGGCGTVVSKAVEVKVLPTTEIISLTQDQNILQGSPLVLVVNAVGDNLNYIWRKDGSVLNDNTMNYLQLDQSDANTTGIYSVRVNGTCGSRESIEIYVYIEPGIPEFPEGLNIWPTLTKDIVNVALDSDEIFDVYIYNSMGIQLGSKIKCRYKTSLDLGKLSPDMYFIEIRLDNSSKIYRIVKIE